MAPILGIWASSKATTAADTGAMFPLQVITVGPAGASSVSFTNIPNTYSHLQLRSSLLTASGGKVVRIQFNGDTASNYAQHSLVGNGSAASADAVTSLSGGVLFGRVVGTSATQPTGIVTDILDYSSTNKNKTVRSLGGMDANGSGEINLISSLWLSTSAITSITITTFDSTNFLANSQFALYGIKGA